MNSTEVFNLWLAAINSHDVVALTAIMSPDHVFMDSLGNRVNGARSMQAGWRSYFEMCPDYWIRAEHVMYEADTIPPRARQAAPSTASPGGYPQLGKRWSATIMLWSGTFSRTTNRFTRSWEAAALAANPALLSVA